jgi:hypothetical protein
MKNIRSKILLSIILGIFLLSILSAAININVNKREVSSLAIIDLKQPAVFEITLKNNGPSDFFDIYTLVGRVDLMPNQSFSLEQGETKTINLEVFPRQTPGFFSFEYKIRNSKGEIQSENLAINIVHLKDAFNFYADPINPDSENAELYLENKAGLSINGINIKLTSLFFEEEQKINIDSRESKKIIIPIDKEKARTILAGPYIVNAKLTIQNKETELSAVMQFSEQQGIDTQETKEGWLLTRHEITKTNLGNIKTPVEIVLVKNPLAAAFTGFNIPSTNKDTANFKTFYIFEETLDPGETLKVVAKTNWWLLILIVIAIIIILYLSIKYSNTKLTLRKKATFVKTKGGEFALKISIILKARDFIENIKVIDKIPGMVKIYERYGTITPDKVDHKHKRIEWNLDNLNKGEERIFSYIIYSKIGVVGKFELPETKAFFEYKGKAKEQTSNKSFFINEPGKNKPSLETQ